MASGIYCIENIINNKKYIGQSQDVSLRSKLNHKDSPAINNAISKYGYENFEIYIIEYCDIGVLNEREIFWIKELRSHVSEHGYNISWGGNCPMRGRHHSKETKEILRKKKLGTKISLETKKKQSNARKGKPSNTKGTKLSRAKSKYFGVRKILVYKKYEYWVVRFKVENKTVYLGSFKNEIEAAKTYDNYIKENKLPNPLNFPEDYYIPF